MKLKMNTPLTYDNIADGKEFTINNITLQCFEKVQPTNLGDHIDNYFLGISTLGVMLLTYQIITYSMYTYNWYASTDHNIKIRILPLQIYMRDIDAIIQKMQSSPDSTLSNSAGMRRTAHLRALKEQYYNFIEADKYCWIKYKNPVCEKTKFYRHCWCCGKLPTPNFLYELCEYKDQYNFKKGSFGYSASGKEKDWMSENAKKRWTKVNAYNFKKGKKIEILRQVYKDASWYYFVAYVLTLGYCCGTPYIQEAKSLVVNIKDVYLGRYKPYISDPGMKALDLDEDLFVVDRNGNDVFDAKGEKISTKHRTVNGIDDSCSRFFCGWWLGWKLQDMELAVRAELDEEHLKTDLHINF